MSESSNLFLSSRKTYAVQFCSSLHLQIMFPTFTSGTHSLAITDFILNGTRLLDLILVSITNYFCYLRIDIYDLLLLLHTCSKPSHGYLFQ